MKVRIGYGLGIRSHSADAGRFGALVDGLEDLGFDSLWLSERLTGTAPDPLVGLAVAAGRTRRLKLGTSVQVVPGRNPVDLAKAWASLDRLSAGRALPAFGLGTAEGIEHRAFGVARNERAAWFDEALPVMRQLWSGQPVAEDGPRFSLSGIRLPLTPIQDPLEVWMGGRAPAELRRIGRLADGWLPSFMTPEEVAAGREVVVAAATAAGRAIDEEHWGVLVPYVPAGADVADDAAQLLARRRAVGATPVGDPTALLPTDHEALRRAIEGYVAVGFSKFVVVPFVEPDDWGQELGAVASTVLDLTT